MEPNDPHVAAAAAATVAQFRLPGVTHRGVADTALFSSIMAGRSRATLCGQQIDESVFERMLAPLSTP